MNTRDAHKLRSVLAFIARLTGASFADVVQVLNLKSKEQARALVARGQIEVNKRRKQWSVI